MAKHSPAERMRELHEQIAYHAKKYFVEDAPVIPDQEYDSLYREFTELCDQHPELAAQFEFASKPVPIAEPTGETLRAVQLTTPMLGSKKANSVQEVHQFIGSFKPGTNFLFEQKIDGLALEVRYLRKGGTNELWIDHIVTRGAGMVGEDVTHAWRLFGGVFGIPEKLTWDETYGEIPEELLVRGEGYINMTAFDRLNETYEKKKATPRNAVAGWIRALAENQDEQVVGKLSFAAYWTSVRLDSYSYKNQRDNLLNMGIHSPLLMGMEDIIENRRGDHIPIDGIMVKVNEFSEWDRVGTTSKFPNYMTAYKFPNEEAHTPMEDVLWNTSRFGRVVPTGKYSPVKVGGVMCRSASLDNYGSFMDLGLCVGDVVSVTRNNDVIPRINHVVEHAEGPLLEAPTECPSCSYLLEVVVGKTSADLVCNNVAGCPAQLTRRCVNLVDKFGLDIDGLGPAALGVLVDREMIKIPADIFALPTMAKGYMLDSAWVNIERGRKQPLHRFIKGLGLPDVGIVLAKRIANALLQATPCDEEGAIERGLTDPRFLMSVKGIASGTALKIVGAFDDPLFEENFRALFDALELDLTPVIENDRRVAVTGTFEASRDDLVEHFANVDIELTDKLTKDCHALIVGIRPGKAKLLKATELSIPTFDVADYSSVDKLIEAIKGNV